MSHPLRPQSLVSVAKAELTVPIVAPAPDGVVLRETAAVVRPKGKRREALTPGHADGHELIPEKTPPQLPPPMPAPTVRSPVHHGEAGVRTSNGNRGDLKAPGHP
jgi:hypothetical protein